MANPSVRARARLTFVVISVTLLMSVFTTGRGEAHAIGVSLAAFALLPPTIDGVVDGNEWGRAATQDFELVPGDLDLDPGKLHGSIYVMNDASFLYIGIQIIDPRLTPRLLGVYFDDDHNGLVATAEDFLVADSSPGAPTGFDWHIEDPVFLTRRADNNPLAGGTDDGSLGSSNDGTRNHFEFSHPLCSANTAHDFCLSAGDTTGFNVIYIDFSSFPARAYSWPAPPPADCPCDDASAWGNIVIAGPSVLPLTATAGAAPTEGGVPLTVSFTGSATGGIPPYSFFWNFGDGTTSSEQNPIHVYTSEESFTVLLTVTDSVGAEASASSIRIGAGVSAATPAPDLPWQTWLMWLAVALGVGMAGAVGLRFARQRARRELVVFVCHSMDTESRELLAKLKRHMPTKVRLWVAEELPRPGLRLSDKVIAAIRNADVILAILNKQGMASPWVNQELAIAVAYRKVIIPLKEKRVRVKGVLEGVECLDFDSSNPDPMVLQVGRYLERIDVKKLRTQ